MTDIRDLLGEPEMRTMDYSEMEKRVVMLILRELRQRIDIKDFVQADFDSSDNLVLRISPQDTANIVNQTMSNQYRYKGKTYQFIQEVNMKDPATREWVKAVLYRSEDGIAVREATEFYERFQKVGV